MPTATSVDLCALCGNDGGTHQACVVSSANGEIDQGDILTPHYEMWEAIALPTDPKTPSSIWVTSLPRLLIGEHSCEWASWLRSHYWKIDQKPFDNPTWLIQHTELMNTLIPEFQATGAVVTRERQNSFDLPGSIGNLSGRPDIVAVSGNTGVICEAKAAQPRPEHRIQLLIYLWALPQTRHWKGVSFEGVLAYPDHRVAVSASEIDDTFKASLRALLQRVGGETPAVKVPSVSECRFCPILESECPERLEGDGDAEEEESADF